MLKAWRRSNLAFAARIVVILMLLAALILPSQENAARKVHAIALMDQLAASQSDSIRARLHSEIGGNSDITINRVTSDLDQALQNTLWEFDPETQGAIIVASNGHWNPSTRKTLLNARAARIPVFWVPVLPDPSSSGIARISAPPRARAGQRVGVSVDIRLPPSINGGLVLLANNRPIARKEATASGTVDFLIDVPASGPLLLGAEIYDSDAGTVLAELERGALINIASMSTVLVISDHPSAFGKSLADGGWPVLMSLTQDFAADIDRLAPVALLVLDDVAATDLTTMAWDSIEYAVRQDAMGLLVLGGPNSFGLGGYRDSVLESLLPVISEPPEDEEPASLVFLIDVSGSMDQAGAAGRRLQAAKRAAVETARALRPVDRVGLITFDVQSQVLLPVNARGDHAQAIEQVWPQSASGGTSLMPALLQAVASLQEDGAEQQLLILLTDGVLADADLQQLDALLQSSDIELIAMILGDGEQREVGALAKITATNGGRVIAVDDVLRLPTLMRHEVESRRPAVVSEASQPRVMSPAAWLPDNSEWPGVDSYLLTRPREAAQIYLVSERGDVLLAGISAGAGKVIAVTSGFSGWSENWLQWDQWPAFAADIVGFLAARDGSRFDLSVTQDGSNKAQLEVELQERTLPDRFSAVLVSPSGNIEPVVLLAQGPGKLAATLNLSEPGQYNVVVDVDTMTTRHHFLKRTPNDLPRSGPPIAQTWLGEGLLQLWEPASLQGLIPPPDWRSWLAGLALLLFLSTLVAERMRPVNLTVWRPARRSY
jgi:hypothetical protein